MFRKALAGLVEQYVGNRTVVVNPAVDWVLAGGLGSAVRGTSTQKRCVGGFGGVVRLWFCFFGRGLIDLTSMWHVHIQAGREPLPRAAGGVRQ